MKRRIEEAIRRAGGLARLPGGEGQEFPVSIQPHSVTGEGREETGVGFLHNFKLYTLCNDTTLGIQDGDSIEFKNERYCVRHIETAGLRGEGFYRYGLLTREEKGGYR